MSQVLGHESDEELAIGGDHHHDEAHHDDDHEGGSDAGSDDSTNRSRKQKNKSKEVGSYSCSWLCCSGVLLGFFLVFALAVAIGYWLIYKQLDLSIPAFEKRSASSSSSSSSGTSGSSTVTTNAVSMNLTNMNPFFYSSSIIQQASSTGSVATGSSSNPLAPSDYVYTYLSQPVFTTGGVYSVNFTKISSYSTTTGRKLTSGDSYYQLNMTALSPQIAQYFIPSGCLSGEYKMTMTVSGQTLGRSLFVQTLVDKALNTVTNAVNSNSSTGATASNILSALLNTSLDTISNATERSHMLLTSLTTNIAAPMTSSGVNWLTLPVMTSANFSSSSTNSASSTASTANLTVNTALAQMLTSTWISNTSEVTSSTLVEAYLTLQTVVSQQAVVSATLWADWTSYTASNFGGGIDAGNATSSMSIAHSHGIVVDNEEDNEHQRSHNVNVASTITITDTLTKNTCDISVAMRSLIPFMLLLSVALTIAAKVSQSMTLADKLVCITLLSCLSLSTQTLTNGLQTMTNFQLCAIDSPIQPLTSFDSIPLYCNESAIVTVPLQFERFSLSYKSELVHYYPKIISNANLLWALAKPTARKYATLASNQFGIDASGLITKVDSLFKRGDYEYVNLPSSQVSNMNVRVLGKTSICQPQYSNSSWSIACQCQSNTALQKLFLTQSSAVASIDVNYQALPNYKSKSTTRSAILHR